MAGVIPLPGRVMALDWGERRIGLALSDETQLIASPLETLTRRPGKRFPMPRFLALVAEHRPVGIVVGLPLGLDGGEGPSTAAARELATLVGTRTGLPVAFQDERLTSVQVQEAIREMGGSARGRREEVDALAAVVILQNWLDERRSDGQTVRRSDGR
jgi:putative Holliday junction resolvase